MKMLFTLIFAVLLLTACAHSPQQTPTQSIPGTPTQTAATTPLPTVSPRPTSTVYVNTPKPRHTPTEEPATPTRTPYIPPTNTPGPSPTPTATIIPISASDDFWLDLQSQGYTLFSSSSAKGLGDFIYSAYIFLDSSFISTTPPEPYREFQESEGCRIAFYRFDGTENVFLYSFAAAQFPEKSVYAGYPTTCKPAAWDSPFTFYGFVSLHEGNEQLLHMSGAWSDINDNGFPEFAILYNYCANACLNYGAIAVHFYEIQTTSKVVDITANLPGVIDPFQGFVHSANPLNFYVFDPTLWYCYKWCIIETSWIYAWNDSGFVDITSHYADEFRADGEKILAELESMKLDGTFPEWHLLKILFLYEKAGLRDEAFQTFMKTSAPENWPNAKNDEICWLQITRATVSEDYENNRPFKFPPSSLDFLMEPTGDGGLVVEQVIRNFDQAKHDLSACQDLLSTSTP